MLKGQFFQQSGESGVAGLEQKFAARTEAVSEIIALRFQVCPLASLLALTAWEGLVGKSCCGIFLTKTSLQ